MYNLFLIIFGVFILLGFWVMIKFGVLLGEVREMKSILCYLKYLILLFFDGIFIV